MRTPASKTSLCACMPLNEGSREGWIFSSRPRHFRTNSPVTILINPAKQTSSTPASSNAACTAMSKSKRLLKFLCLITWKTDNGNLTLVVPQTCYGQLVCTSCNKLIGFTLGGIHYQFLCLDIHIRRWSGYKKDENEPKTHKAVESVFRIKLTLVGIPAVWARVRPWTPGTFDMTTAIFALLPSRKLWSIRACKFVPEPEISTPTFIFFLRSITTLLSFGRLTVSLSSWCLMSALLADSHSTLSRLLTITLSTSSLFSVTFPIIQAFSFNAERCSLTEVAVSWPTIRTAPIPQLKVRTISCVATFPCPNNHPNTDGMLQELASSDTPKPWGRTRGMFSIKPPPDKITIVNRNDKI